MDLTDLLKRFAEGLSYVDANTKSQPSNRSSGVLYLPGLPQMYEDDVRSELIRWWHATYGSDFRSGSGGIRINHRYPDIPRSRCDMVFSTSSSIGADPEWAVEFKVIRFIGDNGGKNPYGTGKFLSPYKMESSLTTDLVRLHNSTIAPRKAVIGYAFRHSFRACDEALRRHPQESIRIDKMRETCASNDPHQGIIDVRNLLDLVDFSTRFHGVNTSVLTEPFVAWRNPTGGEGSVFGWLV